MIIWILLMIAGSWWTLLMFTDLYCHNFNRIKKEQERHRHQNPHPWRPWPYILAFFQTVWDFFTGHRGK